MRATPLLSSLLALTLLASCQARPLGAPTGARFQLAAGEAAIAPAIPVEPAGTPAEEHALTVDLDSFLATFRGYRRVLAVIADVENIVVTVTAEDGTVLTQTLTRAQIAAGQSSLQFPGMKPGKAIIAAEAFNSTGGSLGKAVQTASVTTGAMPAVMMSIPLGTGGSSGGGSSAGAPSPSPTPAIGDMSAAVTVYDSRSIVNLDISKLTAFGGPNVGGFAVDASGVAWAVSGLTTAVAGLPGWGQGLLKFPVADFWGDIVAQADDPYDMALEPSGAIWYTSLAHKKVTRIDQTGAVLATAQVPAIPSVRGLALDGAGNAWVANGQAVSKIASTGTIVGTYALGGPAGALAVDAAGGFVWVTTGNRLAKVALDGTVLARSAPFTQGPNNDSAGLAVDAQGNVWLADVVDARLIKFGPDAAIQARIDVGCPLRDVAIDQAGQIWAVGGTTGSGGAFKLAADGHVLTEYLLMYPLDTVKVDPQNQVWVRTMPTSYTGGIVRLSP